MAMFNCQGVALKHPQRIGVYPLFYNYKLKDFTESWRKLNEEMGDPRTGILHCHIATLRWPTLEGTIRQSKMALDPHPLPSGKPSKNYGKIHHVWWVNPLVLWPCSVAFCMFTTGYPPRISKLDSGHGMLPILFMSSMFIAKWRCSNKKLWLPTKIAWLVVGNIFFHNIWDNPPTIDELIFFKRVLAPPTSYPS